MLGDSSKGIATTAANFINGDDLVVFQNKVDAIRQRRLAATSPVFADVYKRALESIKPKYLSTTIPSLPAPAESAKSPKSDIAKDEIGLVIENYSRYVGLLSNVKEANKIESPINVYLPDQNRLVLILSSDKAMLIGAKYLMRPEAKKALSSNVPQSTGIYKDKDGMWISAFAPIVLVSSPGTQALVEINYKIDLYINKLLRELSIIILVCLVGFFGTAALSYNLVNQLVSIIKKLDEATSNLKKENYNIRIKAESQDEIGHLAETFEELRISIRNKIDELRASLFKEKRAHLESIITLTNAIDLRDPYTRKHLYRVDKYALLIAKAMRLSSKEIEKLRYGCYLHDIGKLYIEDSLLKKTRLTNAEIEEIKKHPENGAKIIEGIPFLQDAKDIILYHQEHYDGKGYPKGLKGTHIPFLARIVAVADAFDAMTTDRPYQPRIGYKEAMDRIEKDAGIQFDPQISKAFLKYRDKIEKIAKKHF